MKIRPTLDMEALTEAYVFASVPAYLYTRFRENASVETLAATFSPDHLVAEFGRRTSSPRQPRDIIVAYAILVSFTWLNYDAAMEAFGKLDLAALQWGAAIVSLYNAEAISQQVQYVRVRPLRASTVDATSESSIRTAVRAFHPSLKSRSIP